MTEILHWMGEHPFLTFILAYFAFETMRQIGVAFCKIFWDRKPKEQRRIFTND